MSAIELLPKEIEYLRNLSRGVWNIPTNTSDISNLEKIAFARKFSDLKIVSIKYGRPFSYLYGVRQ